MSHRHSPKIDMHPDEVIIHLRPRPLAAFLDERLTTANPDPGDDEPTLPLSHPVRASAGRAHRDTADRAGGLADALARAAPHSRLCLNRPISRSDSAARHGGRWHFAVPPRAASVSKGMVRSSPGQFRQWIIARQRYSGPVVRSAAASRLSPAPAAVAGAASPGKRALFPLASRDAKIQQYQ
jgi:hypothetical protein